MLPQLAGRRTGKFVVDHEKPAVHEYKRPHVAQPRDRFVFQDQKVPVVFGSLLDFLPPGMDPFVIEGNELVDHRRPKEIPPFRLAAVIVAAGIGHQPLTERGDLKRHIVGLVMPEPVGVRVLCDEENGLVRPVGAHRVVPRGGQLAEPGVRVGPFLPVAREEPPVRPVKERQERPDPAPVCVLAAEPRVAENRGRAVRVAPNDHRVDRFFEPIHVFLRDLDRKVQVFADSHKPRELGRIRAVVAGDELVDHAVIEQDFPLEIDHEPRRQLDFFDALLALGQGHVREQKPLHVVNVPVPELLPSLRLLAEPPDPLAVHVERMDQIDEEPTIERRRFQEKLKAGAPAYHSERRIERPPARMRERVFRLVHVLDPRAHFKGPFLRVFLVTRMNVQERQRIQPSETVELPDPLFIFLRIAVPVDLIFPSKVRLVRRLAVKSVLQRQIGGLTMHLVSPRERFQFPVEELLIDRDGFPVSEVVQQGLLFFERRVSRNVHRKQREDFVQMLAHPGRILPQSGLGP